ncbi:hypothetical protein SAY87_023272 [Trapa incisa]|uniref:Uncharacterized protein n=1 Tax=Trapa incisa TaxID=236973 RepID=A0AAN7Q5K8_9MYRT|nr:hypothetical protein SAY87_023272 [Trapa incisa]
MDATSLCGLYERKLKELNPAIRNITYDISDLYNFIDGLADLSALIIENNTKKLNAYIYFNGDHYCCADNEDTKPNKDNQKE